MVSALLEKIVDAKSYTGLQLAVQTEEGLTKKVELETLDQFRRDLPAVGYEEKKGLGNWHFFVRQGHDDLHPDSAVAVNCTRRGSIDYVLMSNPEKALGFGELVKNAGIIGPLAEFDRSSFVSTRGYFVTSSASLFGAASIPALNYALGLGLSVTSLVISSFVGAIFGLIIGSAVLAAGVNDFISKSAKFKESRIMGNLANLGNPENYLYGKAAAEAIYKEIREQKTAGV